MDNREIGTRIRLARRDAGLTQEKLAEKIGVSTVFVSQLESGSRAPGLETLVKLSQTLHVSLDLLVLARPAETRKRVLLRWCRGARPASVCWRSAWCEACLQRWTVWMQSRRNADACVFRKRRESAARGAGKTLRGTDLRQGNGPVRGPADIRKNSPGNKMLFRRAVFFIQYYFRGKRAAFCHRFCRSVCSSRRATSVSPGTMAQASRSISGVGGSMSGTITVKHPAAAPARTPL